jgi:unsaturated rhamnogalacturonyl hydrolase
MNFMNNKKKFAVAGLLLVAMACNSCKTGDYQSLHGTQTAISMANSQIQKFPEAWMVLESKRANWNYMSGLVSFSMIKLWEETGDEKYYAYAKQYADKFIDENGQIDGYQIETYNIDNINSGKFIFYLYKRTGDERYKKAIIKLMEQVKNQPRTSEGGFWHKQIYPWQMWLDGLYMHAPFYAQYALEFNEPECFDDIVHQFALVHKHTYNPATGLNYHAWDERKQQIWANPETGLSPHFWGRALGWYSMALVDVLDFIPKEHPGRSKILEILKQVAAGIEKHQDKESGLWYQVLDQGNREGNYLEASASSMFIYSLMKASRLGYIDKKYEKVGMKGYKGLQDQLVRRNEDGTISLTSICLVAGLSAKRDGSYQYYVSEPVVEDEPKGVGPFILASIEAGYFD